MGDSWIGHTSLTCRLVLLELANAAALTRCVPDTGERYLPTPMFEGIKEDMDEAEVALSRSTPGYQMG